MAEQLYGQMYAFVDMQLLEEALDVDLDYNPDAKPVTTIVKGYAGVTKGAGTTTVSVTNALPRNGAEVDFITLAKNQTFVDFVVTGGVKQYTMRGTITGVKMKGGVSGESRVDFTFIGSEPTVK